MSLKIYKEIFGRRQIGTLRVGIAIWSHLKPECYNVIGFAECEDGLELQLISLISRLLNVTVEFVYSDMQGCGYRHENGTWMGLIGMLLDGRIDIIGNLCTLSESRRQAKGMSFSWPVLQYEQAFVVKYPTNVYSFSLGGPFSTATWYLIYFTLFVFICLLTTVNLTLMSYTLKAGVTKALHETVDIIIGTDSDSKILPAFVLLCFVGFVSVLYAGFITSVMLKMLPVQRPFKNHVDLVDSLSNGEYRVSSFYKRASSIRCYDPTVCERYKKALDIHGFLYVDENNTADGQIQQLFGSLVNQEKLVYVGGTFSILTYLSDFKERKKLWMFEDELSAEEWSVIFVRTDSNISRLIDTLLITMGDAKETLKRLYYGSTMEQIATANIVDGSVDIQRYKTNIWAIFGVLLAYIFGAAASSLVCFIEIVAHKLELCVNQIKKAQCKRK